MHKWPRFLPRCGVNLTQSPWFEAVARQSFKDVDVDGDGRLDFKELYIALLKLYDLLNSKLPCHVKVPKLADINALMVKFDTNKTGKLELEEYVELCKALVGTRGSWRDSLFLRIGLAVLIKAAAIPALTVAVKAGLCAVGLGKAERCPNALLQYAFEAGAKQLGAPI